jgi:hypothetical protein
LAGYNAIRPLEEVLRHLRIRLKEIQKSRKRAEARHKARVGAAKEAAKKSKK